MAMIHALHGNFGQPRDWTPCLPDCVPARVWSLWEIRRNHPEARSLTGFARWLNARAGETPCSSRPRLLAGYSLGGRLALHVLLDQPDQWDGALIVSAHPGLPMEAERRVRLASDAGWASRCRTASWPDLLEVWNGQKVLQSAAVTVDTTGLEPWREEIASAFMDWSLGAQDFLPPRLLAGISCPVTVMAGRQDAKFRVQAELLFQTFAHPEKRIALVPGAGHRLLHEAPAAVRRELRTLAGLASPGHGDPSA